MILQFSALRTINNDHGLIKGLTQNGIKKQLKMTVGSLALVCALHSAAVMKLEDLSLEDSLWLTFATATTVGYGDFSSKTTEGRLTTAFLLGGLGITLLAQTGSLVFTYRDVKRKNIMDGKRKWKMNDHIVILNAPEEAPVAFFKRLVTELRSSNLPGSQKPIIIVSPDLKEGLPDDLRKMGVAHVNEELTDEAALLNSDIRNASTIVILSKDEESDYSDSISIDLVERAREVNDKALIIAEAVSERNVQRMKNRGANSVLSPNRAGCSYIPKAITAPGTEVVAEEIIRASGPTGIRYDFNLKGIWRNVVQIANDNDIGTPIGYVGHDNNVVPFPDNNEVVDGKALLIVVREGEKRTPKAIERIFTHSLTNG